MTEQATTPAQETPGGWVEVHRSRDRRSIQEHGLVLQALGIEHGALEGQGGFALLVPVQDAGRARLELQRYAEENRGWPPVEDPPGKFSEGALAALSFCFLLLFFGLMQTNDAFGYDWTVAGRNSAELVRSGEWWRTITALTLHADLNHLLNNLLFGFVFCLLTSEVLGAGLGLASIVLSGAIGNLVNALVQSPDHLSIGASTAVFAALGLLVGYQWRRRKQLKHRSSRRWVPVIAGISLLGFLGVEGERTDVMAHITGFGSGFFMGLWLGKNAVRMRLNPTSQTTLLLAVPVVMCLVWWLALAV